MSPQHVMLPRTSTTLGPVPEAPAGCCTRRSWFAALPGGVLGLAATLSAARAAHASTGGKPAISPTSFYNNFSRMTLVDQDGKRLLPARLLGKTVLVNFVFTGCSSVCPAQTRSLVELQMQLPEALKRRVHQLSISVDPLGDTPAALKAFAGRMGCDLSRWSFVVSKPEELDRLSQSLVLFRPDPGAKRPDDHNTSVWLVDGRGELRMRYSGNPPDVPRLLREMVLV